MMTKKKNVTYTLQDLRGEMNFDGERYYRFNRFSLKLLGLWPYNNSIYIYIYRAFTISVLATSCITQLAKLQSTIHDLDRLLYNLTYAVPSHIYLLKFFNQVVHINKVREMMDRVQHDWNTLEDKTECEIVRYNTIIGMRYTVVFFVISFPLMIMFVLDFYLPGFLDFVRPLNESRPKRLPILAEYYILDEQKHFYLILHHQSLVTLLGLPAVLCTETLNLVYVHHACGLFEVAGFLDYIRSTFTTIYLIMLMLGMFAITINMFRLIEAILIMNDLEELIAALAFILGQYGFLFFANFFGQKITDRSILLFEEAYDIPWYKAPVQIQKLLLFILQKTMKGYMLNIGSIIVASLEGFASMASMTLSYLTIIYSVR